jgi:hypothetical protein
MDNNVPYRNEAFPKGTERALLTAPSWKILWRLGSITISSPEQLEYADRIATVEDVGFYHGGDPLYWL